MRALSTGSKLLAYLAAALGVVASVSMPWFGRSPEAEARAAGERAQYVTIDGPVEEFFGGLWRAVSAPDGVSAAERFGGADTALLVLAALGILAAGLAALRGGELVGRSLMQLAALAIAGLGIVKLVQVTGSDLVEARRGAVVALGCAGIMLMTASHVAQQKLKRQPPAQMSSLHDPNLRRAQTSVAPPGR